MAEVGGGRAAKTWKPGCGCGGGLSPPAALNLALCGSRVSGLGSRLGKDSFRFRVPSSPLTPLLGS